MFTSLAFLAVLSVVEIIGIALFVLALLISVSFDRRGHEEPKWITLVLAFVLYMAWSGDAWTIASLITGATSTAFWAPVGMYLVIGLAYAVIVEFGLEIRRAARNTASAWATYIQKTDFIGPGNEERRMKISDAISMSINGAEDLDAPILKFAKSRVEHFATHFEQSRIVKMAVQPDRLTIEPRIDKVELGEHLGAWTIFWPAYAITMIIGDLLAELFQTIGDFIVSLSGRLVRVAFSNVFKL